MRYKKRFVEYYDLFKPSNVFKAQVKEIQNIISSKKYKTILDVGCGTGKHAAYFKQAGYDVSGLDYSKQMISYAKTHVKGVSFYVGDVTTFSLNKTFDVIVAFDSVLTFLTGKNQFERALRNLDNHLNKGGMLIFDTGFVEKLIPPGFTDEFSKQAKKGSLQLVKTYRMKRVGDKLKTTLGITGIDGRKKVSIKEKHIHRVLNKKKVVSYLKGLGYAVKTLGGYKTKNTWKGLRVIATKT